jgi:hypothetical protein
LKKSFLNTNLKDYILEIAGGAVLLLWAHTFSPFGMNRQKRILVSEIQALLLSPPLVNNIGVKIIPSWRAVRSDGEG